MSFRDLVNRQPRSAWLSIALVAGLGWFFASSCHAQNETAPQESDGGQSAEESSRNEPAGNEPAGNEPAGNELAGNELAGNELAGNELAGNELAGQETAEQESADSPFQLPGPLQHAMEKYPDLSRVHRVFGISSFNHHQTIHSLALTDDGSTLLTTTNDKLSWWNADTGEELRTQSIDAEHFAPLIRTNDPERLLYATDKGAAVIIDSETGQARNSISKEKWLTDRFICDADISDNGNRIAIGMRRWTWSIPKLLPGGGVDNPKVVSEGGLLIRKSNYGKRVFADLGKKDTTLAVRWLPDSEIVAAGRYCGRVDFLSTEGDKEFPSIEMRGREAATGIDISSDGQQIAVVSSKGTVGLWNIGETEPVWYQELGTGAEGTFRHVPAKIRFDGDRLLVAAGHFVVRSRIDGSILADPFLADIGCRAFDFSVEKNLLCVATGTTVRVMALDAAELVSNSGFSSLRCIDRCGNDTSIQDKTEEKCSPVNYFAAISGTDNVLLVQPFGKEIVVRDVGSGELLRNFSLPFGGLVKKVHVSRDGNHLFLHASDVTMIVDITEK